MTAQFDRGRNHRARLGFIVLANEETVEQDVFDLCPSGVGPAFTRVTAGDGMDEETIAQMRASIRNASALLLPDLDIDSICFTCSGGTFLIGEEEVCAMIEETRPGVRASTVIGASLRAIESLGATRISILTPYPEPIHQACLAWFRARGVEIVSDRTLGYSRNSEINNTTPEFIRDQAIEVFHPDAELMFVCCGALRALGVVNDLEEALEVPVVTSNQAMAWDSLRAAGIDDVIVGYGALMAG